MLSVREFLQAAMGAGSLPESKTERFTERERQVFSYVFEGLINKEIAERIGVSESSVKATLQQLFSKTGVRTRSQLVRVALEQYRNQSVAGLFGYLLEDAGLKAARRYKTLFELSCLSLFDCSLIVSRG